MNLTDIDLNYYPSPGVQRRLETYLLQSSHSNWRNFFYAISNDPTRLGKFKDYLNRNVSAFFYDTEMFEYLQKSILPELARMASPQHLNLRVWSVGCTCGYDAYSLAIILAEATGFYRRHYILATDIDRSTIKYARSGGPYSAKEVEKVPPHLLERYFDHRSNGIRDGGYYVAEGMRRKVAFRRQNPLAIPSEGKFDIIVCRDAMLHLTARRLCDMLRPGGVLSVNKESATAIPRSVRDLQVANTSFYRRKKHQVASLSPSNR